MIARLRVIHDRWSAWWEPRDVSSLRRELERREALARACHPAGAGR